MKNSGVEWIGEIPDDWNIYRNKNAFTCKKEIVGKKSNSTQLLSLTTGGIKCKDINNAEGKLPESFDTYQYVKKNDVVMCLFDLDISAVFSGISHYNGMISPAYKVLSCQERANPLFIHYWFSYIFDGRKFNHYAKNIRYTLNYDEFAILPIPLPPKETQQKIAAYLDSKCSKIEETIQNQQQVIEKLKAYKQSLITEVVTGKIKIQNGKVCGKYEEYKDSGVEWIGKIPSEWKTYKTKFLSKKITDGAHISPETDNGIYDFVSTADLKNGYIDFENCLKTSPESYKYFVSTGCKPQKGDVLISKDGTVGKTVIIQDEKDFVIASSLVIIRPDLGKITSEFLNYALLSSLVQETLLLLMHGSGLKRVSVKKNSNLIIFVPRMEEQKSISDYLDKKCTAIDTAIEQKQKLIEKLTEYKKSLIYECVTGKKEI